MKNFNSFLDAYENNINHFDMDVFEDDLMDIPYQIETLENNFDKLTVVQKQNFIQLNSKLEKLTEATTPQNENQKKILKVLKESIALEQQKHLKVA